MADEHFHWYENLLYSHLSAFNESRLHFTWENSSDVSFFTEICRWLDTSRTSSCFKAASKFNTIYIHFPFVLFADSYIQFFSSLSSLTLFAPVHVFNDPITHERKRKKNNLTDNMYQKCVTNWSAPCIWFCCFDRRTTERGIVSKQSERLCMQQHYNQNENDTREWQLNYTKYSLGRVRA